MFTFWYYYSYIYYMNIYIYIQLYNFKLNFIVIVNKILKTSDSIILVNSDII